MIIPVLIVVDRLLLNALLHHCKRHMNTAVITPVRRQIRQLHRIECRPRITIRNIRQKVNRILIHHHIVSRHTFDWIFQRPTDDCLNVFLRQRLQLKNPRPRKQSAVHLKVRILRRRPDQDQRTVFDKRQKVILLRLVEAMNLIDEKDCPPPVGAEVFLRSTDHIFQILLSRIGRIDLQKRSLRRIGNHMCQRRLARARRTVENDRTQTIRLDGTIKERPFSDHFLLTDNIVQRLGAHTRR